MSAASLHAIASTNCGSKSFVSVMRAVYSAQASATRARMKRLSPSPPETMRNSSSVASSELYTFRMKTQSEGYP